MLRIKLPLSILLVLLAANVSHAGLCGDLLEKARSLFSAKPPPLDGPNLKAEETVSFLGGQEGQVSGGLNGLGFSMLSDKGAGLKYDHNEDSAVSAVSKKGYPILLAVDGVGGHAGGAEGSKTITKRSDYS